MKTFVCILLMFLSSPALPAESFYGIFYSKDDTWLLTLTTRANKDAYTMGGIAVEIVKLCCDGVEQRPEEINGIADCDYSTYGEKVEYVSYTYDPRRMLILGWDGNVPNRKSFIYKIREGSKFVEVQFRIHFPDGSVSALNRTVMRDPGTRKR